MSCISFEEVIKRRALLLCFIMTQFFIHTSFTARQSGPAGSRCIRFSFRGAEKWRLLCILANPIVYFEKSIKSDK